MEYYLTPPDNPLVPQQLYTLNGSVITVIAVKDKLSSWIKTPEIVLLTQPEYHKEIPETEGIEIQFSAIEPSTTAHKKLLLSLPIIHTLSGSPEEGV